MKLSVPVLLLMMLMAGGLAAAQGAVNAQLSRLMESPVQAAFISFLFGTLALCCVLFVVREGLPAFSQVRSVPPLYYIGGVLGAIVVTSIILLVPRIGVVNVMLVGLAGQMVVSLLIDHHGWLGVREQPVDIWRLSGVALVLVGVLVLNRRALF